MKEKKNNKVLFPKTILSVSVALVLMAVLVTVCVAGSSRGSHSLNSMARDIVFVGQPRSAQLATHWNPSEVLDEVRQVVMVDQLKDLFAQFPRRISPSERDRLARMLVVEGYKSGIDPLFLAAVIRVESAFYSGAVSDKGARGLMQVMPTTGEEVARRIGLQWTGPNQLHDLETNVRLGVYYLEWLLNRYSGNYKFALTAYNRGPTNVGTIVRRHGKLKPQFTEYFRKIQQTYQEYLRSLEGPGSALLHVS
jgi:soluble lytic murein transglycosylase